MLSITRAISAAASEKFSAASVRLAQEAAQYVGIDGLDAVTARKLDLLRAGIVVPAPANADKIAEQAGIVTQLGGLYGKGYNDIWAAVGVYLGRAFNRLSSDGHIQFSVACHFLKLFAGDAITKYNSQFTHCAFRPIVQ